MGAGASSDKEKGKTIQRTVVVSPTTGGGVGSALTPPRKGFNDEVFNVSASGGSTTDAFVFLNNSCMDTSIEGKWQVEENGSMSINSWTDFDKASSDRIEQAFKEGRTSILITLNNRISTVELDRFVVCAGGASSPEKVPSATRRVRRVGAHATHSMLGDPFAIDDTPAVPIIFGADESAGEVTDNGQFAVTLHSEIYAHKAPVFCGGFSVDGLTILSSAKDGTMKYWEVASSFLRQEFEGMAGSILCTSLSPSAPFAACGADDHLVRVFALDKPRAILEMEGHTHKVYGVGHTRDGRTIVSSSMDKTMKTWDVIAHKNTRSVQCHSSSIFSQTVSRLSPWLVLTASDDHTLVSHDLRVPGDGCITRRFKGHTKTLWGCDIRYDEQQFISCGMDNTVLLWDPRQETQPVLSIASHSNPVHCVEYLPDGHHFLSSGRDKSFKISSSENGSCCLSTQAHEGHVYRVTYSATTNTVMTCGADTKVKLWHLKRKL